MRFLRWFLGLVIVVAVVYLNFRMELSPMMRAINLLIPSCFMCLWRIYKGPTPADRIVALDIIGILIIGFCGILSIFSNRVFYIEIAIAWALQSFIATIALAKFLEGKDFDD
ncbi:MAG: multiple resistance and pH regulation protein F [Elusimicrobia bacterium RIFOXYB2_FULL_48_7]|nr:MAG: multiple resistance and pH regulation protein F [Elusimicrobia bacterium RIFOXYB2_FULL_48_7]